MFIWTYNALKIYYLDLKNNNLYHYVLGALFLLFKLYCLYVSSRKYQYDIDLNTQLIMSVCTLTHMSILLPYFFSYFIKVPTYIFQFMIHAVATISHPCRVRGQYYYYLEQMRTLCLQVFMQY